MSVAERLADHLVGDRQSSSLSNELAAFTSVAGGVDVVRELILDFAVRGKLVAQDDSEGNAEDLVSLAKLQRRDAEANGSIRRSKPDSAPTTAEAPYTLPTGWVWTRPSIIGVVGPKNDVPDETEVSFLPMASIDDGFSGALAPESRQWQQIKKGFTHVADGDVVLAKITPCFQNRKSAVIRGLLNAVGAGTTELHVLRPFDRVAVPEYLLLHFKCLTFLKVGVSKMTGSAGQKRVPREYFTRTPIALPPLAEQKRIVSKVDRLMGICDRLESERRETLSLTDRSRRSVLASLTSSRDASELASSWRRLSDHFEILHDRPETLADLRQTILALAVQGKLVKQDPDDEPNGDFLSDIEFERHHESFGEIKFLKRVFDEEKVVFQIPDTWSLVPLAKVAVAIVDCPHSTPKWTDKGPMCVRTNQFNPGWLDTSKSRSVSEETFAERTLRLVPRTDDILYSREGGILGVACRVPEGVRLCLGQRMMLIRPPKATTARFIELVLNSPQITGIAKGKTTGAAAPRVNVSTVKAYPVPIPPFSEQHNIIAKSDRMLALCDRVAEQLRDRQATTEQLLTATIHRILDDSEPGSS